MVILTEEMVIVRTKQSNLGSITKLNFWGSQLSDISILRKLSNVVVLSLSVNNIDTLEDIQYCKRLQDLFIRKNNIKDLNEVCYLKDLHQLKSLWLDENPCSTDSDRYRLAVIKTLPQLQKLDDVVIENSEIVKAKNYGKTLYRPDQIGEYCSDSDEEEYDTNYVEVKEEMCPSPELRPVEHHTNNYSPDPQIQYQREREYVGNSTYENEETAYNEDNRNERPLSDPAEIPNRPYKNEENYNDVIRHERPPSEPPEIPNRPYKNEKNYNEINRHDHPSSELPEIPRRSYNHDDVQETHTNQRPPQFSSIPRSRTTDGEFAYEWKRRNCQGAPCCVLGAQKRSNERRTNVLNAVLCLIKELDYPNLEVVQMAVNCRMEELSDEM